MTNDQILSKESLDLMHLYFKKRQEKMIAYKQASSDIREEMEVMNSIIKILKPAKFVAKLLAANVENFEKGD